MSSLNDNPVIPGQIIVTVQKDMGFGRVQSKGVGGLNQIQFAVVELFLANPPSSIATFQSQIVATSSGQVSFTAAAGVQYMVRVTSTWVKDGEFLTYQQQTGGVTSNEGDALVFTF